jgi:hypothetical protein
MTNNTDWLYDQSYMNSAAPGVAALGNPWLTALGMAGQMGAGMLAGTDKAWLGAPGAVAGNVAKNIQAGDVNKDQLATLMTLAKALQDPVMKGAKVVTKPDGTTSIDMSALAGADQQAMNQQQGPAPRAGMVPPNIAAQQPPSNPVPGAATPTNTNLDAASALGNSPFLAALYRPWA